jgi:hypothetical protein
MSSSDLIYIVRLSIIINLGWVIKQVDITEARRVELSEAILDRFYSKKVD